VRVARDAGGMGTWSVSDGRAMGRAHNAGAKRVQAIDGARAGPLRSCVVSVVGWSGCPNPLAVCTQLGREVRRGRGMGFLFPRAPPLLSSFIGFIIDRCAFFLDRHRQIEGWFVGQRSLRLGHLAQSSHYPPHRRSQTFEPRSPSRVVSQPK
jgi:hypothetical protein